jgi:hypothetical protein
MIHEFAMRRMRIPVLLLCVKAALTAQSSESGGSPHGITFDASVQGSTSPLGAVTKLDPSAGYIFNRFWSVDVGLPFYFIAPSSSTTAATGSTSAEGIGNVYTTVRFTLLNPLVNYVSTVTGTAPTGDRNKGLSTGHATVDWSNYFDRGFGRLTPFAEIGIANAVSDTEFFIRPYTTYGFVTHGQGGARYRFASWFTVNASAYAIEPAGQQTVVSRIVPAAGPHAAVNVPATSASASAGRAGAAGSLPPTAVGAGRNKPVFETTTVTTGSAAIARDNGLSTWVTLGPARPFHVYAGYTRSLQYDLDSIFFGVAVGFRKLF